MVGETAEGECGDREEGEEAGNSGGGRKKDREKGR